MSWAERINQACTNNDWRPLIDAVPFARFLDLRIDVKGEEFTCILPFQEKLIGNPTCRRCTAAPRAAFSNARGFFTCCGTWTAKSCPRP